MIGNSLSLTAHATESGVVSIQMRGENYIYIERGRERERRTRKSEHTGI